MPIFNTDKTWSPNKSDHFHTVFYRPHHEPDHIRSTATIEAFFGLDNTGLLCATILFLKYIWIFTGIRRTDFSWGK